MSGVSYAQDIHGSFARDMTREILRRLFGGVTHGVCLTITPDDAAESVAVEWLHAAGWRVLSPSDEVATGETHLLLAETTDRAAVAAGCDFSDADRIAATAAARRPWVVAASPDGRERPALEQRLAAAGYSFIWFDGTYRYHAAREQMATLELALAEPLPLETLTPPYIFSDARTAMTLRCRDCDVVPKVADAGRVIEEPGVGRIQVMHNGIRVVADGYGGAWMTRLIGLCRGHHEPQEERVFHEVSQRLPVNASMIEIGGYWAYYSLWFLSGGSNRFSIVVEPDPAHLEIGRRNAALNGLSPEFVTGFVEREAGPMRPFQTESSGIVDLPCLSVPQLLAERGLDRLDLLHCDAQGAEVAVLESCRALCRRGAIGWVFVSTHAYQITGDALTHQRCLALVRALGGQVVAEHDVHESFSGDGLIVAWFGPGEPDPPLIDISRNRYTESMFRNPLYDLVAERGDAARARSAAAAAQAAEAAAVALVAEADNARAMAESARAEAELRANRAAAALTRVRIAHDAALREVTAIRESTCWRATAPLRLLSGVIRRPRGRRRRIPTP